MTSLVRPDPQFAASWIDTVADFGGVADMHGSGHWNVSTIEASVRGCQGFVAALMAAELPTPGQSRVASTYFWVADGDEVIGFLNLRHHLNEFLLEEGGHIGYSIRPSRRREGHASRALALGARRAGHLGIDRVLVTCDDTNEASRRTILAGGGVLEDVRNHKERYWIATGR